MSVVYFSKYYQLKSTELIDYSDIPVHNFYSGFLVIAAEFIRGDRQETFIKNAVSTNRDMLSNRVLLKVVRGRTQSLLRS